ncbi:hypothetical protein Tco_1514205, partial [Tanacetum coccineum]
MTNFAAKYSIMTQEMVDSFCDNFYIPDEVHPTALGRGKTITQFSVGKVGRAVDFGMQEGLEAGYEHGVAGRNLFVVDAYNPEVAKASYINAVKALEDVDFP